MAENAGVSINMFNDILMDDRFLMYAVGEFERYVNELNTAVRTYQKQIDLKEPSAYTLSYEVK